MDDDRTQWLTHAAYLRQRADDCKAVGKWGEARRFEQEALEIEQRLQREQVQAREAQAS